jgi:hypothetical protein
VPIRNANDQVPIGLTPLSKLSDKRSAWRSLKIDRAAIRAQQHQRERTPESRAADVSARTTQKPRVNETETTLSHGIAKPDTAQGQNRRDGATRLSVQ